MNENNNSGRPGRLLMIGLDAAEYSLVERWAAEGLLPNLAAIGKRGIRTPLTSTARWLVGAPWPSFYSSSTAEQFGMYHYLVWRPESMTAERPDPGWMPLDPFWRRLPEQGRKVLAVDVPLCYAPRDYGGVEISGWATHELLQKPGSSPPGLLAEIRREMGRAPFDEEGAHQLTVDEYLEVRDQCVETARRVGDLGCSLMRRHEWDLALICFSSMHRGGHLLWDRTILKGNAGADRNDIDTALRDVYVACDAAVGQLAEAAGPDAAVMVFSLHGMGPNTDRTSLLPEMLKRILHGPAAGQPATKPRLAERLRGVVPADLRARVKKRLPQTVQDRLTLYWRSAHLDWPKTRAFITFCDLDGYIRINLRGRERDGTVNPEDYPRLCEEIAAGLRTFRDADTGEPLVSEIGFADAIFPDGPMRKHLPDIIVRWHESSAALHRRIVSGHYGTIDWPTPGAHPLGRCGNHFRTGFLLAAGGPFADAPPPAAPDILDLAPTALDVLQIPKPPQFRGTSLLDRGA